MHYSRNNTPLPIIATTRQSKLFRSFINGRSKNSTRIAISSKLGEIISRCGKLGRGSVRIRSEKKKRKKTLINPYRPDNESGHRLLSRGPDI